MNVTLVSTLHYKMQHLTVLTLTSMYARVQGSRLSQDEYHIITGTDSHSDTLLQGDVADIPRT